MSFVECHDESCYTTGYIQSFGYLIGIDVISHSISFFSENIPDIFKIENAEALFGKKMEDFPEFFKNVIESDLFLSLDENTTRENITHFDKILIGDQQYHFSVFRTEENIIFEFEKVLDNHYKRINNKYDNFYIIDDEQEIWDQLLNTLSKIVDYDRMMIYKLMTDGSGKVIAEKTKNNLESYIGLYFPESEIPREERELYLKKRKRIFSNVHTEPVKLLSRRKKNFDLTFAASKSISPTHKEYIKKYGASSSFSISIIIEDHLWGLVTCENSEARHIDLEDRVHAGIFTALASNAYSLFKSKKELDYRLLLNKKTAELKSEFSKYNTLFESLIENKSKIKAIPKADGLAIISNENIVKEGLTPTTPIIEKIVRWAHENTTESIYENSNFLKKYRKDLEIDKNAAGIIIYFIDREKNELLIWFRKEFNEHIKWARNPHDFTQNENEAPIISEQTPFKVFTESSKGSSKRWDSRNINAAHAIRDVILETSHKQYIIIKQLNEELKKVNEELDSFSYTISHDLGTPLTVMKLNAQMLLKSLTDSSEKSTVKINSIIEEIDSMAEMMHDVLQLSRAKHSEIQLEIIQPESIILKITENAKITFGSPLCEVIIKNCPPVLADKTMLHQVFLNIINNAVKYSSNEEKPEIIIKGSEDGDFIVYSISDNGIGIPEDEQHKMFKIFNRMDNAKKFKGNGVGLSIVQRIMKRIGGNVDYKSNKEGTCFFLTFKNPKFDRNF